MKDNKDIVTILLPVQDLISRAWKLIRLKVDLAPFPHDHNIVSSTFAKIFDKSEEHAFQVAFASQLKVIEIFRQAMLENIMRHIQDFDHASHAEHFERAVEKNLRNARENPYDLEEKNRGIFLISSLCHAIFYAFPLKAHFSKEVCKDVTRLAKKNLPAILKDLRTVSQKEENAQLVISNFLYMAALSGQTPRQAGMNVKALKAVKSACIPKAFVDGILFTVQ